MKAFQKVLLAVAIVAAGYGVAALFGRSAARPTQTALSVSDLPPARLPSATAEPADSIAVGPSSKLAGDLRLVPEPPSGTSTPIMSVDMPPASPNDTSTDNAHRVLMDEAVGGYSHTQPMNEPFALVPPRAKLRNEAPRALGPRFDPHLTVDSVPAIAAGERPSQPAEPHLLSPPPATAIVARSEETEALPRMSDTRTVPAAHEPYSDRFAVHSPPPADVAPLPFQSESGPLHARSHIIVDGDSLAKLAGRYLDDPHRAQEIYEYNRAVLKDPELLPIGIELAIPPRHTETNVAGNVPQSQLPRSVAIHSPVGGGLVPVRPVPAANVVPRAYLATPRPAQ